MIRGWIGVSAQQLTPELAGLVDHWDTLPDNVKRAILTLEKGTPGDKLVKQAFQIWNKG